MNMLDMRVPLRFAAMDEVQAGHAAFVEGADFDAAQQEHPAGCACCAVRNPAGRALALLLQERARGKVAFFQCVVAVTRTPAGQEMVLEALRTDPVASACFRLVPA